ncbi:MAG: Ig-like domain-containing protein, partial [Gemmatimonadaceae bacterium]
MTVTPSALALQVGQSVTAVATVDRDVGALTGVTWASTAPAIATVDSTGKITAIAAGTAVITATSKGDATKSAALAVTVTAVANNLTALSVAPTSANLGVGGSVQLVANATTVGSPTVTITYASSNTAVATVSSTGLVTAVGNGTAIITTTASTSTNSLSATTTINIASASVSISTITAGGLSMPVNLANVAGQIEVTLNIAAGNQTLDSVRVMLGNQPAATQVFTVNGAPSAPVTLSINTAAYTINADSTATASFLNGTTGVSAQLFTQGSAGPTASNTINLTLNNADTFHQRWSVPTSSTTGPNGFIWYGGAITLNVIPVIYSGNTVTSVTFGLANCSSANVTDTSSPFVATFTCSTTQNANVTPVVTSSIFASGNPGPTAPNFANQAQVVAVRLDNVGPSGSFVLTNVAPDNWIGGPAVASSNWYQYVTAVTDAGVGAGDSTNYVFQYDDRATLADTTWVTNTANPSNVPENAVDFTNSAYAERVFLFDKLGNRTVVYLGGGANPGAQLYGVDVTPPTLEYLTTALEPNIVLPATDTLGNTKILTNDPGIANTIPAYVALFGERYRDTRSGFSTLLNNGQSRRITRLAPSGVTCALGTGASCAFVTSLGAIDPAFPTYRRDATTIYGSYVPSATPSDSSGYYTYETFVMDRAGNKSATISKTIAVDVGPAQITGIGVPASLTGAATVAFTPTGTDDLEIFDGALALTYPNMTVGVANTDTLYFPRSFFADIKAPFSGAPLSNVIGLSGQFGANGLTLPIGFLRGIDSVATADSLAPVANAAGYKPTAVAAQLFDIRSYTSSQVVYPNLPSAFIGANILAGLVPAGAPVTSLGVGGKWYVFGAGTTGSAIQATARTLTSVTNAPFPQVAFFRLTAPGRWVYLGAVTSVPGTNPTIFDQGTDRFWTYTMSGVSPAIAA